MGRSDVNNSIDFQLENISNDKVGQLHMASHGRPCYYTDFDPKADEKLMQILGKDRIESLNGCIADFRFDPSHPNQWTFMRFRPDKKVPNDSKTVEKVIQSIKDNVRSEDLLEREAVIRSNWKAREAAPESTKNLHDQNQNIKKTISSSTEIIPRSQTLQPPVNFRYPLNLRTKEAKAAYKEADGWWYGGDDVITAKQEAKRLKTQHN